MLQNFLQAAQLNEKEIKIFMKLLELGAQPASNIARLCDLPRNTVRSILDKLTEEGFLQKTRRANTQYYSPETQTNIIKMLKLQKIKQIGKIDRQIELIERYGSELNVKSRSKTRPKITFYEGLDGLEKVYEDTLTSKSGLQSWASYDHLLDVMPDYFGDYFKRRAKKKIKMTSIHPDTPKAREAQSRDILEFRESALIPAQKFDWQPEIQVYDDKVNITSWKEKIGIIIESEEIANAFRAMFELSYEAAKRYGQCSDEE